MDASYGESSVNVTVQSTMPGSVWCIVRKAEDPVPSSAFMKSLVSHSITTEETILFDNLHPATPYIAYCYAESAEQVPMGEAISDVAHAFTTKQSPIPRFSLLYISSKDSLPLGAITRTKNQVDFFITSPIAKTTTCYLYLFDGSVVNTMLIHPESWSEKHSFRYLKPTSSYRLQCGLSAQQIANAQFEDLTYLVDTAPVQASSTLPWIGILVLVGGVVCGVVLYLRRGSKEEHAEDEEHVEDEVSLLHDKPFHGLSREATAALQSLETQTWRCEICTHSRGN